MPKGNWQTHGLGRLVNTMLGGTKLVRQKDPSNPNGPDILEQVPMKPGELFRHVLGAGILGLAAGAGTKDFGQGFQRGYGAEKQQSEHDEQQLRQQNQQDFENQRQQRNDALNQRKAESEINYQNSETEKNHMWVADAKSKSAAAAFEAEKNGISATDTSLSAQIAASAGMKMMLDAVPGLKPVDSVQYNSATKDVAEKKLHDPNLIPVWHTKSYNPITVTGPDGKSQITVSEPDATIDFYDRRQMKDGLVINKQFQDNMITMHPEDEKTIKKLFYVGRVMKEGELTPLYSSMMVAGANGAIAEKQSLDRAEKLAQIAHWNSQTTLAKAQTGRINKENERERLQETEQKTIDLAFKSLNPKTPLSKEEQSFIDSHKGALERALTTRSLQLTENVAKAVKSEDKDTIEDAKQLKAIFSGAHFDVLKRFNLTAGDSGAAQHFRLPDGAVVEIPQSGVDAFRKDHPNAVSVNGLGTSGRSVPAPNVSQTGKDAVLSQMRSIDPKAADRLSGEIERIMGAPRGGQFEKMVTIQDAVNKAYEALNRRMGADDKQIAEMQRQATASASSQAAQSKDLEAFNSNWK
jgi:hypothetical protein